jgi:D-alanyl-D-alanine carboxypeptidase
MTSGGYGSAKDMAKLFQYIIENKPTLLEATQYEKLAIASKSKVHTADNTNKIVSSIPALIASKTGLTDLSGGNLVIAFDAGLMRPIIISVLGSSEDGRFSDMQKLVEASLYSLKTP